MKQKTLVILAAGMGSRFGGLKQIEPVDENNHFIIDYSIFDAIKAGFNKIVFIIKKENFEIFKSTIGKRIEKFVKVDYVFQDLEKFVDVEVEGRQKPWGTGHAVLCAKEKVKGDFVILNADDFYGFDAFKTASEFIEKNSDKKLYGLIGYKIGNTLSINGQVKRGICYEYAGFLKTIIESNVHFENNQIFASPIDNKDEVVKLESDHLVSMNMMCLNSDFFEYLEKDFKRFLKTTKDLQKDECLVQYSMFNQTFEEGAKIKVVPTQAKWYGVTYKEDKPYLVEAIKKMIDSGLYPKNLWEKR